MNPPAELLLTKPARQRASGPSWGLWLRAFRHGLARLRRRPDPRLFSDHLQRDIGLTDAVDPSGWRRCD
ncbi:MAG: hypothetical protein INR68_07825 [Methylobacterium mesophilicum]|nr:hypothetical protein [Methylobacterium mesophilicum]